jgi:hypothetical protein
MAHVYGPGMLALAGRAVEGFDDRHVPVAAWTWRKMVKRLLGFGFLDRRSNAQQPAGERHGVLVR